MTYVPAKKSALPSVVLRLRARRFHLLAAAAFALGWIQSAFLEKAIAEQPEWSAIEWAPSFIFWFCAVVAVLLWLVAVALSFQADRAGDPT